MQNSSQTPTKTVIRPRWAAVTTVGLAAAALAFVAGVNMANTPGNLMHEDTTIAQCSAFEHTSNPHFDGPIMDGLCVTPEGAIVSDDQPEASPIDRCKSDDFNDGSQDLCWTQRTTDNAVLVIDSTDTVVSTSAE